MNNNKLRDYLGNKIEFHHIGMVVKDIKKYALEADIVIDEINGVKVFLLELPGVLLEIVEPINKHSPAYGPLKDGQKIYHMAFTTSDIQDTIDHARKNGFVALWAGRPAKAFGNKNIHWFFKEDIGLIELISV